MDRYQQLRSKFISVGGTDGVMIDIQFWDFQEMKLRVMFESRSGQAYEVPGPQKFEKV
jgi:hypothetical protein